MKKTIDIHFRDQWNVRHPISKLLKCNLVQKLNSLSVKNLILQKLLRVNVLQTGKNQNDILGLHFIGKKKEISPNPFIYVSLEAKFYADEFQTINR